MVTRRFHFQEVKNSLASSFLIFFLIGMNSPENLAEMEHARSGEFFARKLSGGVFSGALANGGRHYWRIVMLVILLASVSIPLRTALMQVARETVTRGAVQEVIGELVPNGTLVSQQVEEGSKISRYNFYPRKQFHKISCAQRRTRFNTVLA